MSKKYVALKDIRKMLGVSVIVVHKALRNHSDINPEPKKKVLQAVDELGYIKNEAVSNLRKAKTMLPKIMDIRS